MAPTAKIGPIIITLYILYITVDIKTFQKIINREIEI